LILSGAQHPAENRRPFECFSVLQAGIIKAQNQNILLKQRHLIFRKIRRKKILCVAARAVAGPSLPQRFDTPAHRASRAARASAVAWFVAAQH
jgi:hypothetical protein